MLTASPAIAQRTPSLNDLAIDWARGTYASPLTCEFDGEPRRGLRTIRITQGSTHTRPPTARVEFVDLEAEAASRCMSDLGEPEPNVVGFIEIRLPGSYQPSDTALRDFKNELRRNHGFEYRVSSARLTTQTIGADATAAPFPAAGGTLKLEQARRGSAANLALRSFDSPRKLELVLVAKDGQQLRFPIYLREAPPDANGRARSR